MRRVGITVSAAALAVIAVAVPAGSPAGAAPSKAKAHCATKAQYNQVGHGMSIARVAAILGHGGHIYQHEKGPYAFQWRSYPVCQKHHSLAVRFSKMPKQSLHETGKDYELT